MANLKIRIAGISTKEASINVDWEMHDLNYTLNSLFSSNIEGITINKIKLVSIGSALTIENNSIIQNVDDEILMSDMDAGNTRITYDHVVSSSSILEYQAIGSSIFNVTITFNSIV